MSKSLRIQLEVDVHAVTCPGVWFHKKGPVFLSICFLGFHVKTKPFPPTFPFLFGDKFVFEKTFPGCATLQQLQSTLDHQPLYVELLQEHVPDHPPLVLATFETSGLEFLFPYPQLRPTYNSGVDVDLLMEPTTEFPGVISPKIEASTRCHINETRHAHLDQLHDSAVTLNQVPPMLAHPHLGDDGAPRRRRSRSKSMEGRDPFAWRHVDDELIGRRPDGNGAPHTCDHGPGPSRAPSSAAGMRRSKSAVWGSGFRPRGQSTDSGHSSSAEDAMVRGGMVPPSHHRRGRSRERRGSRGSGHHHHGPPPTRRCGGGHGHGPSASCSPTPPPPLHVHRDVHDHHPAPPPVPPSTVPIAHPPPPPPPAAHPPPPPPPEKPLPVLPSPHPHPHPDPHCCHPHPSPLDHCHDHHHHHGHHHGHPPPVPHHPPPPHPLCPSPHTCAYTCHVGPADHPHPPPPLPPVPPAPGHPPHLHLPPHIHSKPRAPHGGFNPSGPPYHHGHHPCHGPCCS